VMSKHLRTPGYEEIVNGGRGSCGEAFPPRTPNADEFVVFLAGWEQG